MNSQERPATPPRDGSLDLSSLGVEWPPPQEATEAHVPASTRTWADLALPRMAERPRSRAGLLERLRRRMISRWLISYVAVAWVVLQLLDVLADIWGVPLPLQQTITLVLGLGLFPSLVVAWYHGERGRQKVCGAEIAILMVAVTGSILVLWVV